jgi:hypothetical protein
VLVEQFIASFKAAPEELVLDFDATDNPLHGQQEERFFHGYYNSYCCAPTCGPATSMGRTTPQRSSSCWCAVCARPGRGAHCVSRRLGVLWPAHP